MACKRSAAQRSIVGESQSRAGSYRPIGYAFGAWPVGTGPTVLKIDRVKMLVWFYLGWCYVLASQNRHEVPLKRTPVCDDCGGELHLAEITDHRGRVIYRAPTRAPPALAIGTP